MIEPEPYVAEPAEPAARPVLAERAGGVATGAVLVLAAALAVLLWRTPVGEDPSLQALPTPPAAASEPAPVPPTLPSS